MTTRRILTVLGWCLALALLAGCARIGVKPVSMDTRTREFDRTALNSSRPSERSLVFVRQRDFQALPAEVQAALRAAATAAETRGWDASDREMVSQQAVLALNKDAWGYQSSYIEDPARLFQAAGPVRCVSPENPLAHVAVPFQYDLRPGEAVVLVAGRR